MASYFDVYSLSADEIHSVDVYKADNEENACELFKADNPSTEFLRINASKSVNWSAIEKKYGSDWYSQA